MALLNLTQASKAVNKTRQTLYRHILTGRLSRSIFPDGTPAIEESELFRVYGSVSTIIQPDITALQNEIDRLKARLEASQELLISKEDHISSLKKSLLMLEPKSEPLVQAQATVKQESAVDRYIRYEQIMRDSLED
jgi:bacterioferritin (cytochrome b1)